MKNKPLSRPSRFGQIFFAGCCSLLVGACVGPGLGHHHGPCNAGVCKAVVAVQSCERGAMTVDPDPIEVYEPNNIEWTISTPGYVFTTDGIVISGAGFKANPGVTGNGKKYIVHDDHTDLRKMIKYVVRVKRESDGAACKPFDPFINNN
ncbi:MAG: hypothetical protein NDI88_12480 [Lysobacter sp.]|nr:hypothetical protein [Lysobacter sp.]